MKINSLSASSIKSYITCPFKVYLEKQLKVEMPSNFGAEQGTLIHAIFEEVGNAQIAGDKDPDILRNWTDVILEAYQKNGIWQLSRKALARKKSCKGCPYNQSTRCWIADQDLAEFEGCPIEEFEGSLDMVEKVLNDKSDTNPLNQKIIDTENKFVLLLEDNGEVIPVAGIIDVVTEMDDDTIEIWDYKTGNYVQSLKECKKDPQFLIYHVASRAVYPKYKNAIISVYYLKKNPISFTFGTRDEKGTIKALKHYWHRMRNDISPKRRCDRADGSCKFDFKCKYMCSPEICQREWEKFRAQGGVILDNEQIPYEPRDKERVYYRQEDRQ